MLPVDFLVSCRGGRLFERRRLGGILTGLICTGILVPSAWGGNGRVPLTIDTSMATKAVFGLADCRIQCAKKFPDLGEDYDACVTDCREKCELQCQGTSPNGELNGCDDTCAGFFPDLGEDYEACLESCTEFCVASCMAGTPCGTFGSAVTGDPSSEGTPNFEALQETVARAENIQALLAASADPIRVTAELRELFTAPTEDLVRARFVDRYFVTALESLLILAGDERSAWANAVHDLVLGMARVDYLDAASPWGRTKVLQAARELAASPEERQRVERLIEHYQRITNLGGIVEPVPRSGSAFKPVDSAGKTGG